MPWAVYRSSSFAGLHPRRFGAARCAWSMLTNSSPNSPGSSGGIASYACVITSVAPAIPMMARCIASDSASRTRCTTTSCQTFGRSKLRPSRFVLRLRDCTAKNRTADLKSAGAIPNCLGRRPVTTIRTTVSPAPRCRWRRRRTSDARLPHRSRQPPFRVRPHRSAIPRSEPPPPRA